MSEDGFLKITGRLSRFSKIGGEMVPHVLIEEALNEAVGAEGQLFAVSAVGDEKKGEKLVVLHTAGEDQVQHAFDALSAKDLPNLFLPKRDQFIKVDAIPILGTGKLDLSAMKKLAEEAAESTRSWRAHRIRERRGLSKPSPGLRCRFPCTGSAALRHRTHSDRHTGLGVNAAAPA